MICYAVIDTNVLVSALLSSHNDAATVQVVSRVFSGEIIPMFSAEILAEYREVLHRKKFLFSEDLISVLLIPLTNMESVLNRHRAGRYYRTGRICLFMKWYWKCRKKMPILLQGI